MTGGRCLRSYLNLGPDQNRIRTFRRDLPRLGRRAWKPKRKCTSGCQMQRLSGMVQSLTGWSDIPFWLDTICVLPDTALMNMDPIISKKQRHAQDQAIVKMRQTYEESLQVLVLDSWVLSDTVKVKSDTEKLMRIFCSRWNTRLWTYQAEWRNAFSLNSGTRYTRWIRPSFVSRILKIGPSITHSEDPWWCDITACVVSGTRFLTMPIDSNV